MPRKHNKMARKQPRMDKVGVIITSRNCLNYTLPAVESVKTKHPYTIFIVDDHSDQPTVEALEQLRSSKIKLYFNPDKSTGLAFNWNFGVTQAILDGCEYFLVANNDILLHPEIIDNLCDRIDRGDVVMATGVNAAGSCPNPTDIFTLEIGLESETEHPDFSCFMINKNTLAKVGWFDEGYIGAYYEDQNYHARIVMLGEKAVTYNRAPYYHYASMTLKDNPQIAATIHTNFGLNQNLFIRQFGCMPLGDPEKMRAGYFKTLYNEPSCGFRY